MAKITLDLPEEFEKLCERDDVKPCEVLRSFIADLCELRTEKYNTRGSDERIRAQDYYDPCGYKQMKEWA